MKALISTQDIFDCKYVSSWVKEGDDYEEVYSHVKNCVRIAEVKKNEEVFEVAPGLVWMDCPEECTTSWYYKDGEFFAPPEDEPRPKNEV